MSDVVAPRPFTTPDRTGRPSGVDTSILVGGLAWIAGTIAYAVAQPVAAAAWTPGYSWLHNYISDLGNTACGQFAVPHGTAMYVCSPRHNLMNGAFVLNGALFLLGAILLRRFWPAERTTQRALRLLIVAGVLKIVVGLAPENGHVGLHLLGALNVPLVSIAVVMLSLSMWRSRPAIARAGMVLALVGLFGSTLSIAGQFGSSGLYLGLGVGGMERLATYPGTLWVLMVGVAALATAAGFGASTTG